jgi:hypothetical protein
MGLSNGNQNQGTIVTIVGGKFTVRLDDNDTNPNAVERKLEKGPKAGQTVKELKYSSLSGKITSCLIRDGEYGSDLVFGMKDGDEVFTLQVPLESRYFGQIVKRLPNVDPSHTVVFGIGEDKQTHKPFLFIKQNNEQVKMAYTKDNPNGMPTPTQRTVKGKAVWDFMEQEDFLYKKALLWIEGLNGSRLTDEDDSFDTDAMDEELPY